MSNLPVLLRAFPPPAIGRERGWTRREAPADRTLRARRVAPARGVELSFPDKEKFSLPRRRNLSNRQDAPET